MDLPIEIWCI